ncbi:MAG: M43 family zinc metalloprotease [Bacteroidota bacterium]
MRSTMHDSGKVDLIKVLLLACLMGWGNPSLMGQGNAFLGHRNCGHQKMTDHQIVQNPAYAQALAQYKNQVIPQLVEQGLGATESAATILTVPVVIHVIHNGEAIGVGANLSEAQILAQLEILNEDFSANNPNFTETPAQWSAATGNPDIQFCLASFDENGNPTSGIIRHQMTVTGTDIDNSNIENSIKPATIWDPNQYYNIWTLGIPGTTAGGGTVGYAYLPSTFAVGANFDGTVVDYRWFGGPGFNQSGYKTLTHETGHYLGLPHTFNGTACGDDDNISDTPNIGEATSSIRPFLSCSSGNFPTGPTSCGNDHMYVNYMDYVNSDYCYTSFTNGQIAVMRGVLNGNSNIPGYASRNGLLNHATLACTFFANDAGINSVSSPASGRQCMMGPVTPQVSLTNFGTAPLTAVTIRYQIDGGTPVDLNWTGNLTSGNAISLNLTPYMPPMGAYTFEVATLNPNGQTDEQVDNNVLQVNATTMAINNLPLQENFADNAFDPTANGIEALNVDTDDFVWARSNLSAYGIGNGSAMFNNFDGSNSNNPFNTIDALLSPVYDLTGSTGVQLTFDLAYAAWSNGSSFFSDSLNILVSTDCGNVYSESIYIDGGSSLATAVATSSRFVPTANQWKTITLDLSNYEGQSGVSFAFVNVSGWGNQLFIDNIEVSTPCALSVNTSMQPASCATACDGSINAIAAGGQAPYTYLWDGTVNNPSGNTASGLCMGSYALTITDQSGCSLVRTIDLEAPVALSLNLVASDETTQGAGDGAIVATASGGVPPYTYLWNTGATTSSLFNLSPGGYTVSISDQNGCLLVGQTSVAGGSVDCTALAGNIQTTAISCHGLADGTAQASPANGNGPYTYFWNNGATSSTVTGLTSGSIMVTITDANGCTFVTEDFIAEPLALDLNVLSTDESVAGTNDGTANAIVSGGTPGYTYQWNNGATTSSINDLSPGNYTVTISDQNGCTHAAQAIINAGPADCSALLAVVESENVSCFGSGDGAIGVIATGGVPPYSYFWSNSNVGAIQNDLTAGTYTVTVGDNNGCSHIETITIETPSLLTLTVVGVDESAPGASDGSATAVANGGTPGYSFLWSNGATQNTIENLSSGIYQVTISDQNACTNIGEVEVGTTPVDCSGLMVNMEVSPVSCAGGADGRILVSATGGTAPYTYHWEDGSTGPIFDNQAAGTYMVRVIDFYECMVEMSIQITAPDELTANVIATDGVCGAPGEATAFPEGGTPPFSYEWNTGVNTPDMTSFTTGSYQVTVIDAAQCAVVETVELQVVEDLTVSCTAVPNGATGAIQANTTGGTAPFNYAWSNGASAAFVDDLNPGIYTLTVTDDNACTSICEVELTGTTATQNLEHLQALRIFPNPTQNLLYVEAQFSRYEAVELVLYNSMGQIVMNKKAAGQNWSIQLDLSQQAVGVYWLLLQGVNGSVAEKIILVR